jgi:hypothetical protein
LSLVNTTRSARLSATAPHQRSLAAIAITAAAENGGQAGTTRRPPAAAPKALVQGIRRMRIIDDHQWFVVAADLLQATRRRSKPQALGDRLWRQAGVEEDRGHGEQIGDVVATEQAGLDQRTTARSAEPETQPVDRFLDVFGTDRPLPIVWGCPAGCSRPPWWPN